MSSVEATLKAKLIRRHPHVFDSDGPVPLAEVERRYEEIKAAERATKQRAAKQHTQAGPAAAGGASAFGRQAAASFASVPTSLPALARADAILGRCERLGITPEPAAALAEAALAEADVAETGEAAELDRAAGAGSGLAGRDGETGATAQARLGAELFDLVTRAHAAGLDAEAALREHTAGVERATIAAAGAGTPPGGARSVH